MLLNQNKILLLFCITLFISCDDSNNTVKNSDDIPVTIENKNGETDYKMEVDSNSSIHVIDKKDGSTEKGLLVQSKRNGVWKVFDKSKVLSNVYYYYNDSLLYVLDKNDYNFVRYNVNGSLSILKPKNWEVYPNTNNKQILASFQKPVTNNVNFFTPLINIQSDSLQKSNSFEDYVNHEVQSLNNNSTFKLMSIKEYGIGNYKATQATYIIIVNDIKLGVVTSWINKGKAIYIINCMASNENKGDFLHYKELFQDILLSCEINN